MNQNFTLVRFLLLTGFSLIFFSLRAQERMFTFSGFGEVQTTYSLGGVADPEQTELYELAGGEEEEFGHAEPDQFYLKIPGVALIGNARLSDNLTARTEVYFENGHDGLEIETHMHRMQLQYEVNEKLNFKAGQFLAPVGFLNINRRFYGYLSYSYTNRAMVNDHNGYVPLAMVGLQVYGSFIGKELIYSYKVAWGANRGRVPSETVLDHAFQNAPGFVSNHEFKRNFKDCEVSLGATWYFNPVISTLYVDSVGGEAGYTEDGLPVDLLEVGYAPYLLVDHPKYQVLVEYHNVSFRESEEGEFEHTGVVPRYRYQAMSAQFALKIPLLKKPFYPYIRYDFSDLANGGYYYSLHEEDEDPVFGVHRGYLADESLLMVGASWDILPFNRIKLEYMNRMEGLGLEHMINFGTAFAF